MSDFINREEVLKKLNYEMKYGAVIDQCGLETAYDIVGNLSSIKIDRNRNFLEIIVEYPKICIYPEYEGKPYYSIKYEEKAKRLSDSVLISQRCFLNIYVSILFHPQNQSEQQR